MDLIVEGIRKALLLLFTLDPEVLRITLLSLAVSGAATLISLAPGGVPGFCNSPDGVSRERSLSSAR